jgi:hypothetical protein
MSDSSASTIKITLDANDLASKHIDDLNKQIAKLQTPSERASKSLGGLTDGDRVNKLAAGMRGVARESADVFQNIGRIVGPLGIITSAASIAGLAALSREWARMGNQIGNAAQRSGVGVEQLSNFQNAAVLSGASAQSAVSGVTAFKDAITNAAFGNDTNAIMALQRLGIAQDDLKDSNGQLRTTADLLPRVAHALAGIKDPTIQHELGNMLFGGSADELMPLFRRFDELTQKASKTGADWTQQMSHDAKKMNEAWARFGEDFSGITNRIEDDWSGMVTKALTGGSNWIEKNKLLADSYTKIGAGILALGAIKPAAWVARLLGLDMLLNPIVAVPAAVAGAAGLGYVGAVQTGTNIGKAGDVGLTPTALDEFGNPYGYKDASGRFYTNEEAARIANNRPFLGEGNYPDPTRPVRTVPLVPGQQQTNARDMAAELSRLGYTREGVAALLGSGVQESGLNPLAVEGGGAHRGVFQWDQTRQAAIMRQFGKPVSSMTPIQQADAAAWELNNNPAFAALNRQLKTGHDLAANNSGVTTTFEAPGNYGTEVPNRLALAQGVLKTLPSDGPAAPGIPPPPSLPHAPTDPHADVVDNIPFVRAANRIPGYVGDDGIIPGAPASPGIQGGSGAPPAPAGDTTVKGGADLRIKLDGFPMPGTSTSATTDGDLFTGPPRISYAMQPGMNP